MKSWFQLLAVFACIFTLQFSAEAGAASRLLKKSSRDVASVGSSKKVKKVKPQGFYIPYKQLRKLEWKERVAYYNSFSTFIKDTNYLMRKNKKYSDYTVPRSIIEEYLIPYADAVVCSASGWLIDNNKSTCDSNTWWYDPATSNEWDTYKPVHLSYAHCDNANKHWCPAVGVEVVNGQARGLCGDSRANSNAGRSSTCTDQFANGANQMIRLFDSCDKEGITGVNNLNCEQLTSDFRRTLSMYQRSCESSPRGVIASTCGKLRSAVQSVAAKINVSVNPGTPATADTYLPNNPTCNAISNDVTGSIDSTQASPHWQALLTMASQNCPGLRGRDLNAAALLFGKCSQNFPGATETDFTGLIQNFSRRKTNPEYGKEFVSNFGITPGNFESLFCASGDHISFSQRLGRINNYTDATRTWLINNIPYGERQVASGAPNIDERQFTSFKEFLNRNESSITDLVNRLKTSDPNIERTAREFSETYEDGLQDKINGLYDQLRANPSLSQNLDQWFRDRVFNENPSPTRELAIRLAVSRILQNQLISPGHAEQTQKAIEFMNACAKEVTEQGAPIVNPAGTYTPNVPNHRGCRYVKETDLRGYTTPADNKPYVIFDRTQNKCLQQDGNISRTETTKPDGTIEIVQSFRAVDPLQPQGSGTNITLSSGSFDTRTDGVDSAKPFVLYRYFCDAEGVASTPIDDLGGARTDY